MLPRTGHRRDCAECRAFLPVGHRIAFRPEWRFALPVSWLSRREPEPARRAPAVGTRAEGQRLRGSPVAWWRVELLAATALAVVEPAAHPVDQSAEPAAAEPTPHTVAQSAEPAAGFRRHS